jgi:DNA-binding NtrC family response regulator
VERFTNARPDAVFLDINMPGMNGVEVLKRVHALDPAVPVIMVTANTDIHVAEVCLKGGAIGYVPKPFNLTYMDHMAAMATDRPGRPRPR